ncbi:RrF2 family transcriptional regulator [Clostridium manihotivorum]|uniref:Rrf2 family transcriptional regulator n=1 Tax=Clostridium manihotivorum TaxID=2320868 RepID=A0A3R5V7W3_9CLOT|nr:Rrf2 family transcriptional regulator [Clostridium manihotivorum]QAA32102.1 Rrf2 family transcriptional regulator [Clostridium manihotivorum]
MKITQEADYGLRVVLYLSKLENGAKINAAVIAEHEGLPLRFLLKLLRKLIAKGIIRSYRGVAGGYSLNKLPEEITLKDVIEAIDGPIYVNRCIIDPAYCNAQKGNRCEIHRALGEIQTSLIKQLSDINFKALKDGTYKLPV